LPHRHQRLHLVSLHGQRREYANGGAARVGVEVSTDPPPAEDTQVVVVCFFTSKGGVFKSPKVMADRIVAAFLAEDPKLWAFLYPVDVVTTKPKDPRWWLGKVPPFEAFTQPSMEKRIVCFSSEGSIDVAGFKQFNYAMDVSKISSNGLRFKVSDYNPSAGTRELWVLAFQTQEKPE
jgi:hypothetical protein